MEVRVLFGALRESPAQRGFRRFSVGALGGGPHSVATPSDNWATPCGPACGPTIGGTSMSIDYEPERGRYRVRWREHGPPAQPAVPDPGARREAFETSLVAIPDVSAGAEAARAPPAGGVYAYETSEGRRWRFVFRQSDGRLTTRRGFASRRAASRPSGDRGGPPWRGPRVARHVRRVLGEAPRRQASLRHRRHAAGLRRPTVASGCSRGSASCASPPSTRTASATGSRTWSSSSTHGELSAEDRQQRAHLPVDGARRSGPPAAI